MFSNSAEYYDRIYSKFKNYEEECEKIQKILQTQYPTASTILDVACGTGKHAQILHDQYGYSVDGVDLEEIFVETARENVPSGNFYQADMTNFSLGKTYDVVMCLFSSIGYVKTQESVIETLKCFRDHLNESGIVIVEPWFTPEVFIPGKIHLTIADDEDVKIVRMSDSRLSGRISRLNFEYLIGTETGIERLSEMHELGLFTTHEMTDCFEKAGFEVEYDSDGLFNRGLYIGKFP